MAQNTKEVHDQFLKSERGIDLYGYQRKSRDMVVDAIITRDFTEIAIEIARQSGKTTVIVETVTFLIPFMSALLGRQFNVGFFAPKYEQAKADWTKARDIMPTLTESFDLKADEVNGHTMAYMRPVYDNIGRINRWQRASEMYAMSLGETTKLESKTLDLAIIEEAHNLANDEKINKEVRPMLTATNGIIVFVGVAGYKLCYFKKIVEESKHSLVFPVDDVIADRKKLYKITGDADHLSYEKSYAKTMRRVGNMITDDIKTQYLLEWVTERGTFVTRQQLEVCKKKFICCGEPEITIGIDFGKYTDPTVATASTKKGQRLGSLELSGTDYIEQVPIILDWIQAYADRGYKIMELVCDATGGGDVVVEILEKQSRWNVTPYVFSAQSKAILYQTFINLIAVSQGIKSESIEDTGQRRFEYWAGDRNVDKFEYEILNMEKEYKGDKQLLSCHHPDIGGAHDDTVDSVALSVVSEPQEIGISFF